MPTTEHTHTPLEAGEQQNPFSGGVELLSKALKTVFIILAVVILTMLAWFLTCGGSFIVDTTTESVVVLKFGKFYGVYQEGWHWFLPYPINKIVRIPTRKETVVSKSFMPSNAAKLRDPNAKTLLGNEGTSSLAPGIDGYALLSDNSIMHSEWVLTYRIGDPEMFYRNCMSRIANTLADAADQFDTNDSETVRLDSASDMLKTLLDSAVIEAGTQLSIDGTYYDPDLYLRTVRTLLQQKIDKMEIGIVMENLSLSLVAPPITTQTAFQGFLLAKTMAEREVEAARTYEVEQKNQALSESEKLISEGVLQKQKKIAITGADAIYFTKILDVYQKDPEATLVSLYSSSLAKAMETVSEKYVISTDEASKSEVRLRLNREPVKKNQKPQDGSDTEKQK